MMDRSLGAPSSNCCSVPNRIMNELKINITFELGLERDPKSSKSDSKYGTVNLTGFVEYYNISMD